jgi:hypothetical protein
MSGELIEHVARAADEYLGAQCGMKLRKHALDRLAKAAIAATQPHIEAQREDAARRWKDVAIKLHGALARHTCEGCPICPGDCSSANPPVFDCPTQRAFEAYRAFDAINQPKENTDATSD